MNGRVVSNKTQKTVTVLVESRKTHPLYKKTYARSKKYLVHDEVGAAVGDLVEIQKSRPFSKRKHWQVIKVVGRDIVPMNEEKLKEMSQEDIEEVMPEQPEDREQNTEDGSEKTDDGKTEKLAAEVSAPVSADAKAMADKEEKKTKVAKKPKADKKVKKEAKE
jgi:small subunit ribosomal protein S17